jgi:hypothetical protein
MPGSAFLGSHSQLPEPDHQLPGETVKVLEREEIRVEPGQRFTRGSRLQFPQTGNLSAAFK